MRLKHKAPPAPTPRINPLSEKWKQDMSPTEYAWAQKCVREIIQKMINRTIRGKIVAPIQRLIWTRHVQEQMRMRGVTVVEVLSTILLGNLESVRADGSVSIRQHNVGKSRKTVILILDLYEGFIPTVVRLDRDKIKGHVPFQRTPKFTGNVNDILRPIVDKWKGKP